VTNERRLTGLAYASLLIVGIHAGWMGPFLPEVSRVIHLSIDRAGLIISATFSGYFVALLVAGALSHRWSARIILITAMGLFAAGLLILAIAPVLPLLLCAGAKGRRYSLPHSRILIHQPSMSGLAGQATDIDIYAKEILRMRETLNQILADATGQPVDRISRDVDRDYILEPPAALNYGLVDRIIEQRSLQPVTK